MPRSTSVPRRVPARGLLALTALAVAASEANAQVAGVNPFSFGVSAGAAIPTGDAGDALKTGYSIDAILAVRTPTLPVGFRGEVGYTRFDLKSQGVGVSGNTRIISGVANAVLAFSGGPTAVVRPYLIGGVGVYNLDGSAEVPEFGEIGGESETKFGLNGGIGLEIPLSGITGFGEIRYTSVFAEESNLNFIPIRFGIRF